MKNEKSTLTRREMLTGLLGVAGASALVALSGCSSDATDASTSNDATETTDSGSDSGSSSESSEATTDTTGSTGSSILVAYFSATGNTRAVAERLAEDLGADIFEVVPQEPYTDDDLNFNDDSSRVSQEHVNEDQRDTPLVQTTPDGFDGYQAVLVGYPIWWAQAAWPLNRFVSDNDFTDKRVITFCTSQASGLGNTTDELSELAGTGNWEEGQRFREEPEQSDVDDWAASLGL
ncbi:MAG: flavodoxin [Tractidigestivibacter sp.]|uniref:flavodoxin n=1 Tax=Tractidigestivibacter sp. TaxID=2847320 RepID=UPI003D94E142